MAAAGAGAVRGFREPERVPGVGHVPRRAAVLQRRHPGHRVRRAGGDRERASGHGVGAGGADDFVLRRGRGGRRHRRARRRGDGETFGREAERSGRDEAVRVHGQQGDGVRGAALRSRGQPPATPAAQARVRARGRADAREFTRRGRSAPTDGARGREHDRRRVRRGRGPGDGAPERAPDHHAPQQPDAPLGVHVRGRGAVDGGPRRLRQRESVSADDDRFRFRARREDADLVPGAGEQRVRVPRGRPRGGARRGGLRDGRRLLGRRGGSESDDERGGARERAAVSELRSHPSRLGGADGEGVRGDGARRARDEEAHGDVGGARGEGVLRPPEEEGGRGEVEAGGEDAETAIVGGERHRVVVYRYDEPALIPTSSSSSSVSPLFARARRPRSRASRVASNPLSRVSRTCAPGRSPRSGSAPHARGPRSSSFGGGVASPFPRASLVDRSLGGPPPPDRRRRDGRGRERPRGRPRVPLGRAFGDAPRAPRTRPRARRPLGSPAPPRRPSPGGARARERSARSPRARSASPRR